MGSFSFEGFFISPPQISKNSCEMFRHNLARFRLTFGTGGPSSPRSIRLHRLSWHRARRRTFQIAASSKASGPGPPTYELESLGPPIPRPGHGSPFSAFCVASAPISHCRRYITLSSIITACQASLWGTGAWYVSSSLGSAADSLRF